MASAVPSAQAASTLFDAYVMVDWSASNAPKRGADSIWVGVLERDRNASGEPQLSNPPTRHQAFLVLVSLLQDFRVRGRSVLVGFDFAFGYPAGFARHLDSQRPCWRGVWEALSARVHDDEDNANNRFQVAANLNEMVSGAEFPFWGCPLSARCAHLGARRSDAFAAYGFAEYRLTDRWRPGPQPVWKLAYPGSVGSQTLLGIPHLQALRHHPGLADAVRIWPFETGAVALHRDPAGPPRMILAEVWPSLIGAPPVTCVVKDAGQVAVIARYFASLDGAGCLSSLFACPQSLTPEQRRAVENEEGWILGIECGSERRASLVARTLPEPEVAPVIASRAYLCDPAEIYRRSFAAIRAEVDLSGLAAEIEPLAVRLIHAAGDSAIVAGLAYSPGAVAAGRAALQRGRPVLVDSAMVAAGIITERLPAANPVICTLRHEGIAEAAAAAKTTRSAAAVDLWRAHLADAVVAIGNAPTALFRLLDLIDGGAPKPALILGFPVGFVGAAQSKEELISHAGGVPYITVRGRRGGSAMAAAAVNALAGGLP
jgi:precorrin-8X/cobalt-precorrin-8 methylmutase